QGSTDGRGSQALFNGPCGIAISADGTLFVAEFQNNVIRKITPDGTVTTFCGSPGVQGSTDGKGSQASFNGPIGIAVDSDGTLFVADTNNHTIRKITSDGTVTTLFGSPGVQGSDNGLLDGPFGVAVVRENEQQQPDN